MQGGLVIALDTPAAIAASLDRPLFAVRAGARHAALNALRSFPHAHSVLPFGDVHHVTDTRRNLAPDVIASELRRYLADAGFADAEVKPATPTVEDVFIERMGGAA
jgi:hypothetical protein